MKYGRFGTVKLIRNGSVIVDVNNKHQADQTVYCPIPEGEQLKHGTLVRVMVDGNDYETEGEIIRVFTVPEADDEGFNKAFCGGFEVDYNAIPQDVRTILENIWNLDDDKKAAYGEGIAKFTELACSGGEDK